MPATKSKNNVMYVTSVSPEARKALEVLKGAVIDGMKRKLKAVGVDTSKTPTRSPWI